MEIQTPEQPLIEPLLQTAWYPSRPCILATPGRQILLSRIDAGNVAQYTPGTRGSTMHMCQMGKRLKTFTVYREGSHSRNPSITSCLHIGILLLCPTYLYSSLMSLLLLHHPL